MRAPRSAGSAPARPPGGAHRLALGIDVRDGVLPLLDGAREVAARLGRVRGKLGKRGTVDTGTAERVGQAVGEVECGLEVPLRLWVRVDRVCGVSRGDEG